MKRPAGLTSHVSFSEIAIRLRGWPRADSCPGLPAARRRHRHRRSATDTHAIPADRRSVSRRGISRPEPVCSGADVQVRTWPASLRPPNAASRPAQVLGRRLAGPIHAGEPLTTHPLRRSQSECRVYPRTCRPCRSGHRRRPVPWCASATRSICSSATRYRRRIIAVRPARATLAQRVRVLAVVAPRRRDAGQRRRHRQRRIGLIVAADRATALRFAAATDRPIVATVRSPP